MTRFRFPLEQALGYKARRERIAELEQMRALAEKQRREAHVKKLQQLLDENAAELRAQIGRTVDLVAWFATLNQSSLLEKQLKTAREAVQAAETTFNEARERYRKAAKEAEALRTLRQEQHQRFLDAEAKSEQTALDAISLSRWQNEQAEEFGGDRS